MKSKLLVATALTSVGLLLSACGNPSLLGAAKPKPHTCRQQFIAWRQGPVKAAANKLVDALQKIQSAAKVIDLPHFESAMTQAGAAAQSFQKTPLPHCADPHGYLSQILSRIQAAGDNARSSGGGLGGLIIVMAPLRPIPGLETKLSAELKQTVGQSLRL